MFACDLNMLEPLVVAWAGIHRHMRREELVFHLRAIDVPEPKIEKLKNWCCRRNILLHVYDHSGISLWRSATFAYPESSMVRLAPLQELHGVGERLLYLDADVIVLADLSPLFEISLNGHPCAACVDPLVGRAPWTRTLGLPPGAPYFNAGVLLIDVSSWSRDRISERSLQFMQQNPDLCRFPDQDGLNVTLCGNYVPLDERYNRFSILEKSTWSWDAGRWAVVHFAAYPKPWNLKKLEPRDLERAGYYWKLALSGLHPMTAFWIVIWLGLKNRYYRTVSGIFATLSRWRQRMTPSWLEERYCRLRFVLTRGKWKQADPARPSDELVARLTIFCIPKSFRGTSAVVQRNAMLSWNSLRPACEIFVFGNEEGVAEACLEIGARHFPNIPVNEFGTPLVDYAFRETALHAANPLLCYVNSDILIFPDLLASAQLLTKSFADFLAVGRRWNFDGEEAAISLPDIASQKALKARIRSQGVLYDRSNIDYFLYPKRCFPDIPPFAVGRPAWDNWMIYEARRLQFAVIDATEAVFAGHQNHDYAHTAEGRAGGKPALWNGGEAERNRRLAGGHLFDIDDSTHRLTAGGTVVRQTRFSRLFGRWREAPEIYPRLAWLFRPLRSFRFTIEMWNHKTRLWLLGKGLDFFPNKHKRQPTSQSMRDQEP